MRCFLWSVVVVLSLSNSANAGDPDPDFGDEPNAPDFGDADPGDADLGDADLGDAGPGDADPGDADPHDADDAVEEPIRKRVLDDEDEERDFCEPPDQEYVEERPLIDISSWLRIGASWGESGGEGVLANQSRPDSEPIKFDVGFATAFGFDATIGISNNFRIGPWAEVAVTDFDTVTPVAGLEAQFGRLPSKLGWFHYSGQGQLTVRLGKGRSFGDSLPNDGVVVGALTWGYLAPWDLSGYERGCGELISKRYMIGARLVATVMASTKDDDFWLATVGLEIEPVGAIRYLFGIRDWY